MRRHGQGRSKVITKTNVESSLTVAVDCLILDKGKILLIKRLIPPLVGYWHLPGGLLRKNERLRDCAIRKAKEETGLDISVGKMVGVHE